METSQINTEKFYPKYLDQDDINNPLSVIRAFFSSDWLPGHLEALLEWRKYVIEEGCFKDDTNGPAGLLYMHKLNAQLVEATYLLSQTKQFRKLAKSIHIHFDEQLEQEENEWVHFPAYLTVEELINPYLAISNFFKAYTIDQYRDFLYEWLETALSANAVDEVLSASDIIYFYENMQKLYEAAWIIRQREFEPILKKNFGEDDLLLETIRPGKASLPLIKVNCRFNDKLTQSEQLGLNELVKRILVTAPSVQMIIHLGTHPDPETYYLLVIADEKEKTPEHEIVNKIEDNCKNLIDVFAIVHKSDAFIKAIEDGSRFFTNALTNSKICYQSPELTLPQIKSIDYKAVKENIEGYWKRWGIQGKDFLDAALHCYDEGNYNLAVFLMHQSVESTLSAILRVILGYRLTVHNLSKMLRLTLMFTDDLRNVFDITSGIDMALFTLLQAAYSTARYKEDFNPDKELIKGLSDKVCKIFITTEGLFEHALNCLNDQPSNAIT